MLQCIEDLKQELKKQGIEFFCEEPLAKHTSFRIGGPATLLCVPNSVDQLVQTVALCRQRDVRFYLLGKGSNLLFSDNGFAGVVVSTKGLTTPLHIETDGVVTAVAGVSLNQICLAAAKQSLTGLEFAYGIPGSLGGAIYMNAGAYGGEMKDVLQSVCFLAKDGTVQTVAASQLQLGYRTSVFKHNEGCILSATLQLKSGNKAEIETKMQDLMNRRKEKQPLEYPSAGSTFKRPEGAFAGALIEQCGLRGYQVGGAAISEKHCGFVVNLGNATCADVLQLTQEVKQIVLDKTGFILEKEIRVVE